MICWPTETAPLVTVEKAPAAPAVNKAFSLKDRRGKVGLDCLQVASEKMEPPKEVTSPKAEVRSLRTAEEARMIQFHIQRDAAAFQGIFFRRPLRKGFTQSVFDLERSTQAAERKNGTHTVVPRALPLASRAVRR